MAIRAAFAELIRIAMQDQTQERIESATGIPQATISRMLNAKGQPHLEHAVRLAAYLDIDLNKLKPDPNTSSKSDIGKGTVPTPGFC